MECQKFYPGRSWLWTWCCNGLFSNAQHVGYQSDWPGIGRSIISDICRIYFSLNNVKCFTFRVKYLMSTVQNSSFWVDCTYLPVGPTFHQSDRHLFVIRLTEDSSPLTRLCLIIQPLIVKSIELDGPFVQFLQTTWNPESPQTVKIYFNVLFSATVDLCDLIILLQALIATCWRH